MTSEAQRQANRRNADKSTGPRTDAGRARSSANSIRHGGYATRNDAITALDPVRGSRRSRRPDRHGRRRTRPADTTRGRGREHRGHPDAEPGPDRPAHRTTHRSRRNRTRRRSGGDCTQPGACRPRHPRALDALDNPADRDIDYWLNFDWARLYYDIPSIVGEGHRFRIEHTWDDGEPRRPRTIDECFERFEALVIDTHGSCDEARNASTNRVNLYSYRADTERREDRAVQARQIIDEFDRTTQLADRVDRSVDRAFSSYAKIRDTYSVNGDDPRNEPNPNI